MAHETAEQVLARLRREEQIRLYELQKVIRLQSRLEENLAEESCLARCSEIAHQRGGVGQLAGEQHATLRSVRTLVCSVAALEVRCAHLAYPFTLGTVEVDLDSTRFCLFGQIPADLAPLILSFADMQTLWQGRHVSRAWYSAIQSSTADRFEAMAEEKPQEHPSFGIHSARAEASTQDPVELESHITELSDQIRSRRSGLVPQLLQLRKLRNGAAAQNPPADTDRLRDLRGDLVKQVSEAEAQCRRLRERERALKQHISAVLTQLRVKRQVREPEMQRHRPPVPRQGRPSLAPLPARGLMRPVPLGKVQGERKRAISEIVEQVVSLDSRFARTLAHALLAAAELKDNTIPSPQARHTALPPLLPAPPDAAQALLFPGRAPRNQVPVPPHRRGEGLVPRPPPGEGAN